MSTYCHSCCAPLDAPDFKGPAADYCKYCTDPQGNLKPREEVERGIVQWIQGWQPGLNEASALQRARHFMRAMPAWAEK